MSAYSYVVCPNPNLTCCVCRNPFVDPVTTTTCSHTFCYECILGALSHISQCPVDRSPLTPKGLGPADSIVRALVDELLVECVHREEGCTHVCQRQLLASHLREECAYSDVPCPERGCAQRMLRKDIDAHLNDKHKERSKNEPSSEENHITELSRESLSCPQSQNGCPFTTTGAEALSSHITSCAYHGLNDFFGISAARHASLVEQNVLLRHRVSALEASVLILRREMEAVRRALGPWFRMETTAAHQAVRIGYDGLHPRSRTLVRPDDISNSLVGEGSNQGGPAAAAVTGAGGEVPSSAETLASYFPTFGSGDTGSTSNIPDTHNRGPHRSILPSSAPGRMDQGFHETYPLSLGFPPMRAPMLPHLAPQAPTSRAGSIVTIPQLSSLITRLDLGNTLEGTLNGLHDNVLGLAAGVDSLSRRSEIALANESLRFGEEIMSLRAGINGLRMQVHTMMMDRNAQVTGGTIMGEESLAGVMPARPFYPPPGMGTTKL